MNAASGRLPPAIGRAERLWHRLNGGVPPQWNDFETSALRDIDEHLLISEIERGSSRLRYTYTGARVDAVTGAKVSGRYLDNIGLPDVGGWVSFMQASYGRALHKGEAVTGTYV